MSPKSLKIPEENDFQPKNPKTTQIYSRKLSRIDPFLHNHIRLQIIGHLWTVKRADMKFLRNFLDITWGNLSFHSTKLEENGYVTIIKDYIGKKPYTIIQITPLGRKKFEEYKKKMIDFLK